MANSNHSRRTVLKSTAVLATAGAGTAALGYTATQPSAAIETEDVFDAADVEIERNEGELDAVTVAPELVVEWTDFGGGLDRIGITLSANIENESGYDLLFDGTTDADAIDVDGDTIDSVDGRLTLSMVRTDVTAVGDAVTVEDFGTDLDPGETRTTSVELTLRVDVVGTQNAETETAFETVSFEVTLSNPEGEATTSGAANTDAE